MSSRDSPKISKKRRLTTSSRCCASNRQRPCDMLSSAASRRQLVWRRLASCCFDRVMSLHTTMKPWSRVALWLMRSQRPSASSTSPVACGSPSRHDRTRPAVTESSKAGVQIAERRARLQQCRRDAKEVGGLRIGERDAIIGVHHHDAFLRAFQRVGEPRLRRMPLRDLALHHCLDVVAHQAHGREQRAQFVGAALGDNNIKLAGGDALGDTRRDCDRAARSAAPAPRRRAPTATAPAPCRRYSRFRSRATVARADLPIEEAVARRIIDQQIDLFMDLVGYSDRVSPSWRRAWCCRAAARACWSRRPPRARHWPPLF